MYGGKIQSSLGVILDTNNKFSRYSRVVHDDEISYLDLEIETRVKRYHKMGVAAVTKVIP